MRLISVIGYYVVLTTRLIAFHYICLYCVLVIFRFGECKPADTFKPANMVIYFLRLDKQDINHASDFHDEKNEIQKCVVAVVSVMASSK